MNNNLKTKTMNNQIEVEINGNKVTLTLTDEQINQLQKAAKKEWWEEIKYPKSGELNATYGFINDYCGSNLGYYPLECVIDYTNSSSRMTYNNIEQAQLAAEYMNLFTEMYNFAQLRNGNSKIDWSSGAVMKWNVMFNGNILGVFSYSTLSCGVFNIAFVKREHAEEAIDIFGERIKSLFSKLQNY